MWYYKSAMLLFFAMQINGCGFEPLYGGRNTGNTFSIFSKIDILPIENRTGQLMRNELERLLHSLKKNDSYSFKLTTQLFERETSLGVKKSAIATRGSLNMTAVYNLSDLNGKSLIKNSKKQISVNYNIFNSTFATLSAQENARGRAVKALAQEIRNHLGIVLRQKVAD